MAILKLEGARIFGVATADHRAGWAATPRAARVGRGRCSGKHDHHAGQCRGEAGRNAGRISNVERIGWQIPLPRLGNTGREVCPVLDLRGFKTARCNIILGVRWNLQARDDLLAGLGFEQNGIRDSVICNNRFLIVPSVRVHNLASRVLVVEFASACRMTGETIPL